MAQQNEKKYDSLWKKVEDLSNKKGLTKSALTEVDKIFQLAKKEKKEAQVIKALLYQINLNETFDDGIGAPAGIQKLEKEKSGYAEPVLSILNSVLAENYWNYFQQHRYDLYGRTETVNFTKDDVSTWTISDFHKKVSELYLASLENKKLLQQTKLETYDPIIVKGNARYLRPTLYDVLAHRALDYFRNSERDVTKPAYSFEVKDDNLFSPAESFAKLSIKTSDSLSLHHKALLICQELISFHANDPTPDALIDADIIRIQIVQQSGIMENKEALYAKALEQLFNKYPIEPAAAKAGFLLASWHANKAASYQPLKDTTNRYEYLEALKICERVIAQNKESEGRSSCLALVNQVKRLELNLQTEKVNVPGQPFRTLVDFKNFSQLYFRIVPVTTDWQKKYTNTYDEAYWKQLTALSPIRNWNQALPSTTDYQKHSAEVKIDALPVGSYALLASVNDNFALAKNPLAVQFFYVSGISYLNNGDDYFVLDRDNGKPLVNATVQLYVNKYDASTRVNVFVKDKIFNTDKNGYFKLEKPGKGNENFQLDIQYNKDRLFMNEYLYRTYLSDEDHSTATNAKAFEQENASSFLFTDRSIYRPGQTVYFKGIALTKDFETRKIKVYTNVSTVIRLTDANGEVSDSITVTTNEFGSFSGKFKLPSTGLNGEFSIHADNINGQVSFSVEEYKRPRFYVDYEKLKGTYKINDSIQVSGYAKAYAGNNIDGASVKFRVVRTSRFIYPWLYSKIGFPRTPDMEITNGIATTTGDGKFMIKFKATPDNSVDKKLEPVFDYKIIAEVTDINGEVRSAETVIAVSYKSIVLNVNFTEGTKINADSLGKISISTKNLNDEFVTATLNVAISKLESPGSLIRKRYWQQPDLYTLSRETYSQLFPYDEYKDESQPENWNKGAMVVDLTDTSNPTGSFDLRTKKLPSGWYVVEVTAKDKDGESVKDIQYIELFDETAKSIGDKQYSWSSITNAVIEPGQKATITIGSSAADLFVVQQIDRIANTSKTGSNRLPGNSYNFINLNNEKKSFDFPATENDRGGFGVSHFFVKNNRIYAISNTVMVPWTNKELSISYESFRDKTLPGSEEKWKLNISGSKKEKVAAEMLVSMYDASLDQFKQHSWYLPGVWPTYYEKTSWEGTQNFLSVQSQERFYPERNNANFFTISYDQLLSFNSRYGAMGRGKRMMAMNAPVEDAMVYASKTEVAKFAAPKIVADSEISLAAGIGVVNQAGSKDEGIIMPPGNIAAIPPPTVQTRKNFNETAFFIPDLKTDSSGNISFEFTIPEALTRWKFQALTHTKDAAFGYSTKDVVTQKQIMVQPNAPRFFREGDHVEFSTKIANITDKEITGTVHLELLNAADMQPIDGWFQNMTANQYFTAEAGKSVVANFNIQIPYEFNSAVVYRLVAKSDSAGVSDGEEAALPVLTNSMLVTESMPINMHGNTTKKIRFEKLLNSGASETLQQHSLTVEFSSNPAWYAVQALPYLMDYPYECSEQTFNRFYANALASKIANASPKIKAIFESWKSSANDPKSGALASNLEKNQELKLALLEETPWVLEAKSEAQQKKHIALLFDMIRMNDALQTTILKLQQSQLSNGGFPWFNGGPDDRFITQYILTGIGHLKKLNALPPSQALDNITRLGLTYLDKRLKEDYDNLLKSKTDLSKNHTSFQQLQYLYMRSFFTEMGIPGETFPAANYYRKQSQLFWLQTNKYMQGMTALALSRSGDVKTAGDILKSLKQNAIVSPEMGMYWKENKPGYFWYQAPVETQSLLIEAFSEISKDTKTVDELKTWLLQQKQTQRWSSTKATADACYALLLQGTNWLANDPSIEIKLGAKTVSSADEQQDAGTGYFKTVFDGPFVNPTMGDITVSVTSPAAKGNATSGTGSSWGAVYWQYFEKLDKITPSSTPLQLTKKLFVEKNSDRGPVLEPITDGASIKVGDKVKVRIELRVDRDMEYVQLKDMRAGCMEPVNVLSTYKYQGGLGYYESTKDASTNFFFNWLPKGTYVFEYPLFATQAGNFSNGVSSIQCMYAPEFSSHSEGVRVNVE